MVGSSWEADVVRLEHCNGHNDVASEPASGTLFRVERPTAPCDTAPPEDAAMELPHGARVLIVDDDEHVRRACVTMLQYLGLDVVATATSDATAHAFEQAYRQGKPFDLVILDLTMVDGPNGIATLARLRQIDPNVCAVVSSGYSDDAENRDFARHGFAAALPKPYTLPELSAAIAPLLRRSHPGS